MTLTERAAECLAQAKAIQSRADYAELSKEVRDWCDDIIKHYGDAE